MMDIKWFLHITISALNSVGWVIGWAHD